MRPFQHSTNPTVFSRFIGVCFPYQSHTILPARNVKAIIAGVIITAILFNFCRFFEVNPSLLATCPIFNSYIQFLGELPSLLDGPNQRGTARAENDQIESKWVVPQNLLWMGIYLGEYLYWWVMENLTQENWTFFHIVKRLIKLQFWVNVTV
jgi:hypothetical protein